MLDNVVFGGLTTIINTWISSAISAVIPLTLLILSAVVGYDVYKKLVLATEIYDGSSDGPSGGSGADSESRDYWMNHEDAIDPDDDEDGEWDTNKRY